MRRAVGGRRRRPAAADGRADQLLVQRQPAAQRQRRAVRVRVDRPRAVRRVCTTGAAASPKTAAATAAAAAAVPRRASGWDIDERVRPSAAVAGVLAGGAAAAVNLR